MDLPARGGGGRGAPPPQPRAVDPAGPEQYTWPKGWFNFGNVVLYVSVVFIVLIVVLTVIAYR